MFSFWDTQEDTPPPPSGSTVFVMRNGHYEPQNFMPMLPRPDILDFDGFVMRRGASAGYTNVRPPEMRQASLLKNPVSLRRDSGRITRVGAEEDSPGEEAASSSATQPEDPPVVLHFIFDALRPCKVSVHLLMTEVERVGTPAAGTGPTERRIDLFQQGAGFIPESDQAVGGKQPQPTEPLPPPPELAAVDTKSFAAGLDQAYYSSPIDLSKLEQEALTFEPSRARQIPIVLRLEAEAFSGEEVCIQYTYASVQKCPASPGTGRSRPQWSMSFFAQKLQHGGQCFVLHEVFGVSSKQALDTEPEGGSSDCVICLSEPRDTAVLPCRHMCFCSYCAGIVRLQCDRCPVCRQKVASLLQFKREQASTDQDAMMGVAPQRQNLAEATAVAASSSQI